VTSEEHGVALIKERAVRAERSLTFRRVVVYRISGGKIVKTWSHDYDLYTLDEFWS
jgi:predicted ester cyclase